MENRNYSSYSYVNDNSEVISTNKTIAKSFFFMFLGALISLLVGVGLTSFAYNVLTSPKGDFTYLIIFAVCFVVQLVITFNMSKQVYKSQNYSKSLLNFVLYSLLTGVTFSFLFVFFDAAILNQVFIGVAAYFLLLALLTYVFRKKIHKAAGFAYVGLSTLVIVSTIMLLVSMFAFNGVYFDAIYLSVSILGIIVFSIITMVDIKKMHSVLASGTNNKALVVLFAFNLYLDFINIFIYILRTLLILQKNFSRRD